MNLETIFYKDYETNLPQQGQPILGQLRGDNIIVYQAFNPHISAHAVAHQQFGGSAYSFNRMSWIKPNFLWIMYRAGWANKANQERILAIEISLAHFETILTQAVFSSYQADVYTTENVWKTALETSEVRLQWDPDHNPVGTKLERRAIQLGLKGQILKNFATDWLVSVEDITDFVQEQGRLVEENRLSELLVMKEQIVPIKNEAVKKRLKIQGF